MNLELITKDQAKDLFNNGIVVYIQTEDINLLPETANTIMLNSNSWDAALNIYKMGNTPLEYGFDNIISWINERISHIPKFFTFNSYQLFIIDANKD